MNENQQENPMYHNANRCNSSKENTMNRCHNRNLSRDQAMPQPSFGRRHQLFCLAMLFCLAGSGTAVAFDQPQIYTLKTNDHVLILGDSTTADGVGVGGYVRLVDQAQHEQIPEQGVVVRAIGYGMTHMSDLPKHWIGPFVKPMIGKEHAPTVVIVNFGLNDSKYGKHVEEEKLKLFTDSARKVVAMLHELQEPKLTVILSTPALWNGLDQTKRFAEAIRVLAAELKLPYIDLYAAHADHYIKNTKDGKPLPETSLTRDGVHFSMVGETFQAGIILQAFGLKPVWKKCQLRLTAGKGIKIIQDPELPSNAPTITPPGHWTGNWPLEQAAYAPGTKVTLKVEPDAGYTFLAWRELTAESIDTKSPQITVTMDQNKWFMAISQPIEAKKP